MNERSGRFLDACNCSPVPFLINLIFIPDFLDLEPVSRHAVFIPRHQAFTVFLGIVGAGEQHAFVTLGFFVFAYAAGLEYEEQVLAWYRHR